MDHANDVIQTVIRPTSGGLAFGAASSSTTTTVTDPGHFFTSHQWVPIASGIVISLIVHTMKAAARPVINATTVGFGAPVASTAEDLFSVVMSVVAIILPILIIVFLLVLVGAFMGLRRLRQRRRALRQQRRDAERLAREGASDGRTRTIDIWR